MVDPIAQDPSKTVYFAFVPSSTSECLIMETSKSVLKKMRGIFFVILAERLGLHRISSWAKKNVTLFAVFCAFR